MPNNTVCHKNTVLLYHYSPASSKGRGLVRKPAMYSSLYEKLCGYLKSLNGFDDVFLHRKNAKEIFCIHIQFMYTF
jgi:hypothetical protein